MQRRLSIDQDIRPESMDSCWIHVDDTGCHSSSSITTRELPFAEENVSTSSLRINWPDTERKILCIFSIKNLSHRIYMLT